MELRSCGAGQSWNGALANLLCCSIVVLYKSSGYDVFLQLRLIILCFE